MNNVVHLGCCCTTKEAMALSVAGLDCKNPAPPGLYRQGRLVGVMGTGSNQS